MDKKVPQFFALITFSILLITFFSIPAFAGYLEIPKFLCERGIEYYEKGDYDNALDSFKKALLASPQGKTAQVCKMYIELIREKTISARELAIEQAMEEALEREKIEVPPKRIVPAKRVVRERRIIKATLPPPVKEIPPLTPPVVPEEIEVPEVILPPVSIPVKEVVVEEEVFEEIIPEEVLKEKLLLDEALRATQPFTKLELELNKAFVIEGDKISRWLVTSPENVGVEREDLNHIKIAAKLIGSTYLHIWDQNGRWTLNIKVIPPKYIRQLIEVFRKKLEQVEPFKFRYSFNRNSFHRGERLHSLERQTLSFDQWLGLTGETPYGDFDTLAKVSKLREDTNLTYLTLGLTDASIGEVSDFDLRAFDYTASFSGLAFPGESLRGVRFDKRAWDKRLSYTAFWGREGQGKFGKLSPGLAEVKDTFITGGELRYSPFEDLDFRLSSFWGYGDERAEYLKENVLGLGLDYRLKKNLTLGGEFGYDSDNLAYILDSHIVFPKLRLSTEFRNIEEDFLTIMGRPSRVGELGGFIEANYTPFNWINLLGSLDVYRDRLFPNPDNPDKFNLDLHTSSDITINPTTSVRLNYQYVNEEGKLSPRQANSAGVGVVKRFPDLRDLTTHLSYGYKDAENPKTPAMDYSVNSLTAGLSLRLLGDLSYYASRQTNWLTEKYSDEESRPSVFETGLDYSSQIFTSPFYTSLRLSYRDEEDATSPHSFLGGEDSLEFATELSYRPNPDFELFASTRMKNIWEENPGVEERAELELRVGGRILWDTGINWNPVATIEGLVYRDLNDDGKKQTNEPGAELVKLYIGKKEMITDKDGFYSVSLRGKKVTVNVDTSTLPAGVVVSEGSSREVEIEQGKVIPVDFRLISRSEIYGVVFEDIDRDGKVGLSDTGIAKVKLSLEDGRVAITDEKGQYYFRKIVAGEHTITLDINSLPLNYLPLIPLTKKITLFEGITYIHNIPLKRAQ